MKSVFLIGLLSIVLAGCGQTGDGLIKNPASGSGKGDKRNAKIEFAYMDFNFGKVNAGTIVKHTFRFKNGGTGDLIISEARPTCPMDSGGLFAEETG